MGILKYTLFTVFVFTLTSAFAQPGPDTTLNIIEKTKIKYHLQDGLNKFYTGDTRAALKAFREVLQADENNEVAAMRIAECYYELRRYDLSLKYIDKVNSDNLKKKLRKDYKLLKGKIYHRNIKLDEAIGFLNEYKDMAKRKEIADSEVDRYIGQCEYAKTAMKQKLDIEIKNLGDNINSVNPEYAPSITADGKTLIFTARRPDTKGGGVDVNSDYKYYEDIYIAEWDEEEGRWGEAQPAVGNLNTEFHDAALSISPDGDYIYITRNIIGVTGSSDIYVSKKSTSGKWGTPRPIAEKPVDINSSYFETCASLTEDGTDFYYISERPIKEASGLADIYHIKKTGRSTWGTSQNLGPTINTPFDEAFVFVHPSGELLFFSSDGHNSLGGYDIFMCRKNDNGGWSEPENLGYPINTVGDEKTFVLSADGKTAYVGAAYEGTKGGRDIFMIDVSNLNLLGK